MCGTCLGKPALQFGCDSADVFRQPRHGFVAMGFVLNTVDARQAAWDGSTAHFCGETGNGIESDSGERIALMRKNNFDAVWEARERYFQVRMVRRQVVEGSRASCHDGSLQLSNGVFL